MATEFPRLVAPDDPADVGKGWVFNGTVAALSTPADLAHQADTTDVHGVDNTAALVETNVVPGAGQDGTTPVWDNTLGKYTLSAALTVPISLTYGGTGAASAPAARVTLGVDKRTTFSNANYTIAATDRYVAQVGTLSTSRTATLPAASAVNAGYEVTVADESGTATAANTIIVSRAGADTIDGALTSVITSAYGMVRLFSDGTSKWTVDATVAPVALGGTGSTTASAARTALGVTIGTNVQAWDADLDALAAIAGAQGDVIYRNATVWTRLAAGTAGQVLSTQGAGANPQWATASGGGSFDDSQSFLAAQMWS